jgi:hypothetical protein
MLFVLGAVYVLLSQALYSSAESIISHDKENQELVLELGKSILENGLRKMNSFSPFTNCWIAGLAAIER